MLLQQTKPRGPTSQQQLGHGGAAVAVEGGQGAAAAQHVVHLVQRPAAKQVEVLQRRRGPGVLKQHRQLAAVSGAQVRQPRAAAQGGGGRVTAQGLAVLGFSFRVRHVKVVDVTTPARRVSWHAWCCVVWDNGCARRKAGLQHL